MKVSKVEYNELSTISISDNRNVVISECSECGYTLAQQIVVKEGNKNTKMFMKGAIHIQDKDSLYNLRDAINVAIEKIEKK